MDSVPVPPVAAGLVRLDGPDELVQAVPYLLGFHPAESLVLVGLRAARVTVTMRVDLGAEPAALVADRLVAALDSAGADEAVAVVYSERWPADEARPFLDLVAAVGVTAVQHGIALIDGYLVSAGRRWSYRCADESCCPSDGVPVTDVPGVFAAHATVAGLVALPSREDVVAQLDPVPDRARLEDRIGAQVSAAVQAGLDGRLASHVRSVKRAIFAAARLADRGAAPVTDEVVARFGVALADLGIRDSVWMAVDDGRLSGQSLWRDLARRLPPPYDAGPLFLVGWAAWRAGNGTLACIAAERAVHSDPGYSAADLLLAAVHRGVDPRRLPRLRVARIA
jgi:hypothetical protein